MLMRQSRRSSSSSAFQPRWVFEKILGTEKAANAAFAEVRKRLIPYDSTSPSPLLGRYGAADGRENAAIFPARRQPVRAGCPSPSSRRTRRLKFQTRSKRHDPDRFGSKTEFAIDPAILNLLPEQGCIELQHDAAGKVHSFHTHPVDEILVIISGRLNFTWDSGERIVSAGDTIFLPAGTIHKSEALEGGTVYAIATRPPTNPASN